MDDSVYYRSLPFWQKKFKNEIDERIGQTIEYENKLGILASLGLSIIRFGHEVKNATTAIDNSLSVVEIDAIRRNEEFAEIQIETDLALLRSETNRILDLGSYVESFV